MPLARHDGLSAQQPSFALNTPPGDEIAERRALQAIARQSVSLRSQTLDQFEELLTGFVQTDARTARGSPKIEIVYERFDAENFDDFAHRSVIDVTIEAIEEWEARDPKSVFAPVFKALMYKNIALTGSMASPTLSSAANVIVDHNSFLMMARATLEAAPHAADANPAWHSIMISTRAHQSASLDDVMNLVKEAGKKFPGNHGPFVKTVAPVMASSKDAARDIESLANLAADNAAAGRKNEAYLRVYMSVLLQAGLPAFQRLQMNPKRFTEGAREMAAGFPIEFVHQRLAMMSCIMADKPTAQSMWQEIKKRPIQSIWGQPEFFDLCQAWAAEKDEDQFEKREFKQREIEN